MKIWKISVLCACVVSLSACAPTWQQRYSWLHKCQSYGFQDGTPEMANCVMMQEQGARADARYDMQQASQAMSSTADAWRSVAQTPTMTDCRVHGYNNDKISCTSH